MFLPVSTLLFTPIYSFIFINNIILNLISHGHILKCQCGRTKKARAWGCCDTFSILLIWSHSRILVLILLSRIVIPYVNRITGDE